MEQLSKRCSSCDKTKELTFFHKNKRTVDGIDYYCKDCRTNMHRIFIQNPLQKEKRNKENKAKRIEYLLSTGLGNKCVRCEEVKSNEKLVIRPNGYVVCKACLKLDELDFKNDKHSEKEKIVKTLAQNPNMFYCTGCEKIKDVKEFYPSWIKRGRGKCIECVNEFIKKKYAKCRKICIQCEKPKLFKIFEPDSTSPDGWSSVCRPCLAIEHRNALKVKRMKYNFEYFTLERQIELLKEDLKKLQDLKQKEIKEIKDLKDKKRETK